MIPAARLFSGQALDGTLPAALAGVVRDSRQARPGQAFVLAGGDAASQRLHLGEARARGAAAVIGGDGVDGSDARSAHPRWAFARASAAAHGLDRAQPALLGVTGSAGKSTTTHCCWWALGAHAARVGTIGWHDGSAERAARQTTPPPEELHAFLAALPASCPGVALEVSSHAAEQQRLAGLKLSGLVFTGLGHDHLDYHRTVAAYLAAKLRIMRWLVPGAPCVINADDATYDVVAHGARCAGAVPVGLGVERGAARIARAADRTWRLRWEGVDHPLPVRLPGAFNAWNAAAGALLAHAAGVPLPAALSRLASLPAVPGRLELLAAAPATYVDYAHTPEAMVAMVAALRGEFPGRRLVCVFGCGGDRDRSKRAPMGRAALAADLAVLTTDNARSEHPRAIAEDVVAGLPPGQVAWDAGAADAPGARLLVELDRATAIVLARRLAGADGLVVVAGKGHETSQEIQGTVQAWDDRAFVAGLGGER